MAAKGAVRVRKASSVGGVWRVWSTTLIRNEMPGTPSAIMVPVENSDVGEKKLKFPPIDWRWCRNPSPTNQEKESLVSLVKSLDTMAQIDRCRKGSARRPPQQSTMSTLRICTSKHDLLLVWKLIGGKWEKVDYESIWAKNQIGLVLAHRIWLFIINLNSLPGLQGLSSYSWELLPSSLMTRE